MTEPHYPRALFNDVVDAMNLGPFVAPTVREKLSYLASMADGTCDRDLTIQSIENLLDSMNLRAAVVKHRQERARREAHFTTYRTEPKA